MNGNGNGFFWIALVVVVIFLLDLYVFQGLKALTTAVGQKITRNIIHWAYWLLFITLYAGLAYSIMEFLPSRKSTILFKFFTHSFLAFLAAKLVFVVVLVGEDVFRLLAGSWSKIASITGGTDSTGQFLPDRRRFISQMGIVLAGIPFASIIYGVTKGKYNFKVLRNTLYFADLPAEFDGFTLAQISDIHAGSFEDREAVEKGVELLKAQKADMVVFTGDLVNNQAKEIQPFLDIFSAIDAPYGKYSILGNHDYGDYVSWSSVEDKKQNFQALQKYHREMGFKLLRDEKVSIEKGGAKIHLLGVENWGNGFGQRGDLIKALSGTTEQDFKILLSHDPSHWDAQVKKHPKNIHLTLSGHTHGMQFGIEIPGFKWSPSKYRYPNWAGLAEEAGKFLYVNRGFGFLGFAGRVGIWPEITVIELKKGKKN
jgi:uncharacterized protein